MFPRIDFFFFFLLEYLYAQSFALRILYPISFGSLKLFVAPYVRAYHQNTS